MFDESVKLTSVIKFITDFNLISCELDTLAFTLFYRNILYRCFIKENKFTTLLGFLEKNQRWLPFLIQELKTLLDFLLDLDFQLN